MSNTEHTSVQLLEAVYKPLIHEYYLYNVFYGGRGGGKSENIAAVLVIMATQQKRRILCIRESQNSIDESVKALIEKWIYELGLSHLFTVQRTTIKCVNGSEFLFMGMKSHNAVSVKSIADINITWIEEAEAFSARSWMLLRPSVTRTEKPRIIISFNPLNDDDVIYSDFVANKPPANSYVRLINPEDNFFFKGSTLEKQMKDDELRLPRDEFEHIWHGKLASTTADSLFRNCNLKTLNDYYYDRRDYQKVVVACDPATTHKDHSNEYGIVVVGKTLSGLYHILDDASANMTPLEFCAKVSECYQKWQANLVVVEVNNGGDFIKSSLIEYDAKLMVKEVRAGSDKVQRAMPVANLMEQEKLRFANTLPKLSRQMRLMTTKGFQGSRGESPDRLDACVWAVYDLAEIRDKWTIYTTFRAEWFLDDEPYFSTATIEASNVCFLSNKYDKICGVVVDLHRNLSDARARVRDSFIVDSIDDIPDYLQFEKIVCEDIPINDNLPFKRYAPIAEKDLGIIAERALPACKLRKVSIANDCKVRQFDNTEGVLVSSELMEYHKESQKRFYVLPLFMDVVYTFLRLNKDKVV